jgi:CMP-N,N'-diacetyllegionaminic acid synthase
MNIIAIIPARGGSKGITHKNIQTLLDVPLITHSILDANESKLVTQVFVSTDDIKISEISESYGAKIIHRPIELAGDTASSESALIHALSELEACGIFPDLVVFLQCTSPIRSGKEIDQAIAKLNEENADSLLSVSPSHRFLWEEIQGTARSLNYDYRYRPRRQEMNPQYVENGSIYLFKPWVLKKFGNRLGGKIVLFPMSEESAWEIDSQFDFEIATNLMKKQAEVTC